jgi:hypothetical protein
MKTSAPLSGLAKLTMGGLVGTGIGFLGAGVDPGPGPRVVKGFLTVGPLYLPPLLVGLVALAIAGLVATRIRWMPAVGGAFASILLIGAATLGSAAVSFRLTHPGAVIGFAEDCIFRKCPLIFHHFFQCPPAKIQKCFTNLSSPLWLFGLDRLVTRYQFCLLAVYTLPALLEAVRGVFVPGKDSFLQSALRGHGVELA